MWNLRRCSQWIMAGLVLALTGTAWGQTNLSVRPLFETAYNLDSLNNVRKDSTMRWFLWHVPGDTNMQRTKVEFAWEYRKTTGAGGDTLILADSLGNPLFSFTTGGKFIPVGGTVADSLNLAGWTIKNKHSASQDTLLFIDSTRAVFKFVGTNRGSPLSARTSTKLEISGVGGAGAGGTHPDGSAYLRLRSDTSRYSAIEFFEADSQKWRMFVDPTNDTLVIQSVINGVPYPRPVKFTPDGRVIADTFLTHSIQGLSPIEFLGNVNDTLIFAQHRISSLNGWNRSGMTVGPVKFHYLGQKIDLSDSSLIWTSSEDDSAGAQFAITDDGQVWIVGRGQNTGLGGGKRQAMLTLMTPRRGTTSPNSTEGSSIEFRHYDLETGGILGIATGSGYDWRIKSTAAANGDTSLDFTARTGGFVTMPQLAVINAAEGDTGRLIIAADQADDALDSVRIAVPNNGPMLLQAKGSASGFKTQATISNTAGFGVDSLSWTLADSGQITPVDFTTWSADPDFTPGNDDSLEVTVTWDTVGSSNIYLQTMTAQPADTAARLQTIDVWSPIMTVPPGFVGIDTVHVWSTNNILMTGSWSDTSDQGISLYRLRTSGVLAQTDVGYSRVLLGTTDNDQNSWAAADHGLTVFDAITCASISRYARFQIRWQAKAWYRGHSPAIGGMVIKWKRQ